MVHSNQKIADQLSFLLDVNKFTTKDLLSLGKERVYEVLTYLNFATHNRSNMMILKVGYTVGSLKMYRLSEFSEVKKLNNFVSRDASVFEIIVSMIVFLIQLSIELVRERGIVVTVCIEVMA